MSRGVKEGARRSGSRIDDLEGGRYLGIPRKRWLQQRHRVRRPPIIQQP
jgi:hypothetical protein